MPHTKLKRYAGSVLDRLDDERKAQLNDWLKSGNMPYQKICKQMMDQWGVRTWPTSLSVYFHRTVAHEILEQRDKTAGVTAEINKEISKKPADYAKAIVDTLGRKSVETTNSPDAHPKVIKVWVDLYCKLEELELRKRIIKVKEKRIRLLERQAQEAQKTAQDSNLTDEEKAERWHQIFKRPFDAQTNGNSA